MLYRMRAIEMSIAFNGNEHITEVIYEWAVRWPNSELVTAMESEYDARVMADEVKGIPLVKAIYITDWIEIQPIGVKV